MAGTKREKNKKQAAFSSLSREELFNLAQKRERELEELDRIAKILVRRDFSLMEIKEKREIELAELKKTKEELEEAKAALEQRVKNRTRELELLTKKLEKQVFERTRELREKIGALEKVNSLMIGRELRMAELKTKIRKLEINLENERKKKRT